MEDLLVDSAIGSDSTFKKSEPDKQAPSYTCESQNSSNFLVSEIFFFLSHKDVI